MASKDRHVTLLVVSRFEFKDKDSGVLTGKGFELRVVHVISADQKSRGAGVEKVYFYDEGRKSIPKVLQAKDFAKLKEKWAEVRELLDDPGPVPPLPEPEPLAGGDGLGGGAGLGAGIADSRDQESKPDKEPDDF